MKRITDVLGAGAKTADAGLTKNSLRRILGHEKSRLGDILKMEVSDIPLHVSPDESWRIAVTRFKGDRGIHIYPRAIYNNLDEIVQWEGGYNDSELQSIYDCLHELGLFFAVDYNPLRAIAVNSQIDVLVRAAITRELYHWFIEDMNPDKNAEVRKSYPIYRIEEVLANYVSFYLHDWSDDERALITIYLCRRGTIFLLREGWRLVEKRPLIVLTHMLLEEPSKVAEIYDSLYNPCRSSISLEKM